MQHKFGAAKPHVLDPKTFSCSPSTYLLEPGTPDPSGNWRIEGRASFIDRLSSVAHPLIQGNHRL